jgi:NADPH:quinone reductase-like Zn-dependent oxidoreductase
VTRSGPQAPGAQKMKAIVCTRYGPPEGLRLEEVERPTPRKNEVCIKIFATAVNSSDCYVRGLPFIFAYRVLARLALGLTAPRRRILGMVLGGEVASVGQDVRSFKEGDQVFGFDRYVFGTYVQYVCWPANGLLAMRPGNLSYEEAAALPFGAFSP